MANNISKINLPNDSNQYDIVGKLGRGLVRATKSSTSTSTAFDLTADGITELYDGLTIWFRNDATASASGIKLNLNNLGLKNVYRSQRNTAVTTDIEANAIHLFVYESANDRWVKMEGTYTGNDNTIGEYGGAVVAGGGNMARYSLIMQTQLDPPTFASLVTTSSTGTSKAKQTCGFLPNGNVLYQNGDTYAEGGTATGKSSTWTTVSLDLRYSFNISSTTLPTTVIGKAIYIKCTMSNGLLYLADTTWWATDLPSTQDNFYYVYVGQMYSRYQCTLYPVHPIYYHNGTKIVEYSTNSGGTDEKVKQNPYPSGSVIDPDDPDINKFHPLQFGPAFNSTFDTVTTELNAAKGLQYMPGGVLSLSNGYYTEDSDFDGGDPPDVIDENVWPTFILTRWIEDLGTTPADICQIDPNGGIYFTNYGEFDGEAMLIREGSINGGSLSFNTFNPTSEKSASFVTFVQSDNVTDFFNMNITYNDGQSQSGGYADVISCDFDTTNNKIVLRDDCLVKQAINNGGSTIQSTLTSSNWTGSSGVYTNTVTISGITASDNFEIVGFVPSSTPSDNYDIKQALGMITYGQTSTNSITFYVIGDSAPTVNITVILRKVSV